MGHEQNAGTGVKSGQRMQDRREWVSPRISRMKATDAEAGPNPVVPEGLGFGS